MIAGVSKSATCALAVVIACALPVTLSGPVAAAPQSTSGGSWPYSNGDLANSRDAVGSAITRANVATLKEAWSFKLSGAATSSVGGYGTLAANPIVVNNVVYIQDLHSNVYALSLATGKLEWSCRVNEKEKSGPGPNGVAVVGGLVYGATPTTVFALDDTTGHVVWSDQHLLKKGQGTFGIQPQVANGRVYLASQYGEVPGGGLLLALNATNGHLVWSFKSVPKKEAGVQKLGLGAGGAWETPLVGSDGSVTFGIGNPISICPRPSIRLGSCSTPTVMSTSTRRRANSAGTTKASPMTSRITTCKRHRSRRAFMAARSSSAAGRWASSTR